VRRRKLRLARLSDAVRRDDALRTTRQGLRLTAHWSLIDERQRRAFQQLCDELRLERHRQRCPDVEYDGQKSSAQFETSAGPGSADVTRTQRTDDGLTAVAGSSSPAAATTTTTTISCDERTTNSRSVQRASSSDVASPPLSVTLHVTAASNSTSGTRVVTCSALCVTTLGCSSTATTVEDSCVVSTSTSAVRQPCVGDATSTTARCAPPASSRLTSPAVRGRVTLSDRQTENPTTNGGSNNNDDDEDVLQNSSSVELAQTLSTHPVISTRARESPSDQCTSSSTELLPVPRTLNNNNKDSVVKVGDVTSGAPCVSENVAPVTAALVNGAAQSPSHATAASQRANRRHQHEAGVKPRVGWSGGCVTATASDRDNTVAACTDRVPPPVPTRTSSVLTRGGTAARSAVAGATVRPSSWQSKANGHLPAAGGESPGATPPSVPRSASAQSKSAINISLSRPSAFKRDKTSPATATGRPAQDVTETEII